MCYADDDGKNACCPKGTLHAGRSELGLFWLQGHGYKVWHPRWLLRQHAELSSRLPAADPASCFTPLCLQTGGAIKTAAALPVGRSWWQRCSSPLECQHGIQLGCTAHLHLLLTEPAAQRRAPERWHRQYISKPFPPPPLARPADRWTGFECCPPTQCELLLHWGLLDVACSAPLPG